MVHIEIKPAVHFSLQDSHQISGRNLRDTWKNTGKNYSYDEVIEKAIQSHRALMGVC